MILTLACSYSRESYLISNPVYDDRLSIFADSGKIIVFSSSHHSLRPYYGEQAFCGHGIVFIEYIELPVCTSSHSLAEFQTESLRMQSHDILQGFLTTRYALLQTSLLLPG